MRILFAADAEPNPDSGAAGTECQTIRALRDLGHDVDEIWATDLPHRIRHPNLHYLLELPGAYARAIARRWASGTYDVVHVNQPYAWRAAREHARRGRPGVFVTRSHGWDPCGTECERPWRRTFGVPFWRFPRGILGWPMQRIIEGAYPAWCVRWSDGIIISARPDRAYMARTYRRFRDERVAVIPQAPAPEFGVPEPPPMSRPRLRRILFASNFSFVKGLHVAAAALSELAAASADVEFTWVCHAPDHARVRALLSPSAAARVELLDWMPQPALRALYDAHGIFLFTSFYEGFGKAPLEAMARGMVVVGTPVGGMLDILEDGQNGLCVPVGDAAATVAAAQRVLRDAELARAISANARIASSAYSWQRVAKETAGFYQRLMELR